MNIELEPFSQNRSLSFVQAGRLKHLVNVERDWLESVQPGTVARYEFVSKGARNIRRIAGERRGWHAPIEANIIRRRHAAIGIATIIRAQQLVHPDAGVFSGNDLDYWLQDKYRDDEDIHDAVARRLLLEHGGEPALLTVVEGHPNPPHGLSRFMTRVGEPASLSTGNQEDTYGVARDGQLAQLYTFRWPQLPQHEA